MIRRLIFFLLVPTLLFSQNFTIEGTPAYFNRAQFLKDSLVLLTDHMVHFYSLEQKPERVSRPIFNEIVTYEEEEEIQKLHNYITINVNDELYLVQQKGGLVFKFENDSIKRVDRSFTHRMQIGSSIFSRDDKIYRYGGYGFWSFRNFFTFFSPELLEWEAHSPINSTEFPEGTANGLFAITDNLFITLNGHISNPKNLNDTSAFTDEIWQYDFEKQKWSYLGNLMNEITGIRSKVMLGDEILIIVNDSKLIRIKPFDNKVQEYRLTTLQHKLYASSGNLGVYKRGNQYYSFVKYDNINSVELVTRNEDEFFGELIKESKLYQDLSPWRYLLLLLALPMLFYIRKFILLNKERNSKITINNDGLIYHRVFFEFEEKELEVINLLLDFDVVHSSDILALVENPNHNYSHNMRTKNQLIDKVNYKFKTMLKIDYDLITSEKSAEDKRIIDYKMDKTYFN